MQEISFPTLSFSRSWPLLSFLVHYFGKYFFLYTTSSLKGLNKLNKSDDSCEVDEKKGRVLTSWLHIQMLPRLLRFTKISFFFQEHHGNHSSFRFFDSKEYSTKFFPNLRDMIILGVFQCLLDNVLLRMFFIDSILDIFVRMRVWNEYIS